jgi:hypothetical protein
VSTDSLQRFNDAMAKRMLAIRREQVRLAAAGRRDFQRLVKDKRPKARKS